MFAAFSFDLSVLLYPDISTVLASISVLISGITHGLHFTCRHAQTYLTWSTISAREMYPSGKEKTMKEMKIVICILQTKRINVYTKTKQY